MTATLSNHCIADARPIAASVAATLKKTAKERDRTAGTPEYEVRLLREAGLLPLVVPAEEILGPPAKPAGAAATFLGIFGLILLSHIFLGIGEGAFEEAIAYTRTQTRPWLTSGVDSAVQDPYLQRHYGELWAKLQGAQALADRVTAQAQQAWDKGDALTHEERGEIAIAAAAAKSLATETGLAITNRMFELMGARSTATRYAFDRPWRDLRTLSLHDPLDYKTARNR
ncbi:MAG: acyl-CoA dehydrogenase family protein [Phormidesmis sp.]